MTYQPPTQLESLVDALPGVALLAAIVALWLVVARRRARIDQRRQTRRDTERHSNERGGDGHP